MVKVVVLEEFTVQEVAEYLKMKPHTIRRWVREGRLEATRVGKGPKGQLRISKASLDEIMATPS